MTASLLRAVILVPAVCLLAAATGCRPPTSMATAAKPAADDHDHDHEHGHDADNAESFAAGITKLESLTEGLAGKLADKAGEEADDAVHEIGHLLEEVRDLAKKEGFTDAAAKALDELEDCFGTVDEAFHSAEKDADPAAALAGVKERLESAFKALKEVK